MCDLLDCRRGHDQCFPKIQVPSSAAGSNDAELHCCLTTQSIAWLGVPLLQVQKACSGHRNSHSPVQHDAGYTLQDECPNQPLSHALQVRHIRKRLCKRRWQCTTSTWSECRLSKTMPNRCRRCACRASSAREARFMCTDSAHCLRRCPVLDALCGTECNLAAARYMGMLCQVEHMNSVEWRQARASKSKRYRCMLASPVFFYGSGDCES